MKKLKVNEQTKNFILENSPLAGVDFLRSAFNFVNNRNENLNAYKTPNDLLNDFVDYLNKF